jgi:hypothetical protein
MTWRTLFLEDCTSKKNNKVLTAWFNSHSIDPGEKYVYNCINWLPSQNQGDLKLSVSYYQESFSEAKRIWMFDIKIRKTNYPRKTTLSITK